MTLDKEFGEHLKAYVLGLAKCLFSLDSWNLGVHGHKLITNLHFEYNSL